MKIRYNKKVIGFALTFLLLFLLSTKGFGAEKQENSENKPPAVIAGESQKNLEDLLSDITELSKNFVEFTAEISRIESLGPIQDYVLKMDHRIDLLVEKTKAIQSEPNIGYSQIKSIKIQVHDIHYALRKKQTQLLKSIKTLSSLNDEWGEKKKTMDDWKIQMVQHPSLQFVEQKISDRQKMATQALEMISDRISPILAAEEQVSDLEMKLHSITVEIGYLVKSIQKKNHSIFSPQFFSQADDTFWQLTRSNLTSFTKGQSELLVLHGRSLFIMGGVVLLFSLGIARSKKWVKASAEWYTFAEHPVATAVFFCEAAVSITDFFEEGFVQYPQGWESMKDVIVLLAVMRLVSAFSKMPWQKSLYFPAVISYIIVLMLNITGLPLFFLYLYVLLATLIMLGIVLYRILHVSRNKELKTAMFVLCIFCLTLFWVLILFAYHYNELALYSFNTLLFTSLLGIYFWLLLRMTMALLEMGISFSPLQLVHQNSTAIVRHLSPIIMVFYFGIFILILLLNWDVYQTKEIAMVKIQSFQVAFGPWQFSPAILLAAMGVCYGAFIASRAIQSLLRQVVLPRYRVAVGVQFSIIRLVNYFVLFVGFLMVLKVFGFELTSLTILGGALGIGVGFGLQAIITNLASGLILLFEQPVKVGDIVQVNDEVGEIQVIGLRATVVQTFDDAKIIIPNSDLITGQVVNWTLTDRRVRVRIPVGVAYGTDTTRVLEILIGCAQDNPMVVSDPHPVAVFLAFGDSSLDFELRVWILEFNEKIQVLSDLNQSIEDEFRLANITIPFPQRDLHIQPPGTILVDREITEKKIT